jgi:hypothetical protein
MNSNQEPRETRWLNRTVLTRERVRSAVLLLQDFLRPDWRARDNLNLIHQTTRNHHCRMASPGFRQ